MHPSMLSPSRIRGEDWSNPGGFDKVSQIPYPWAPRKCQCPDPWLAYFSQRRVLVNIKLTLGWHLIVSVPIEVQAC